MSEKTTIQLDINVRNSLDEMGFRGESMNDIVKRLIDLSKKTQDGLKTAVVDPHGKASISRTLAGKTIEWRVKE